MENKEILHKASELRELAILKQVTYDMVISMINSNAKQGIRFFNAPELPEKIIHTLIQNGFEISSFSDPTGILFTKVKF